MPAALIAQPGSLAVRIANPGNVTSNSLTLTVNPPPRITALAPSSITAGAPQFTMSVTGTNLFNGTTVQWNGQGLATTFVSTTQLTAVVPASAVAAPGTASVTAITLDGVVSNALPFTINPGFTITALSPATANVGSAAFTMTVTGTNLPQGVAISFGGQTLATTVVSATQIGAVCAGEPLDGREHGDLAGAEFVDLLHLRREEADALDVIGRVGAHHADAPVLLHLPSTTRINTTTPR